MTHQEIKYGDVIDRYVLGKLSADARQSFQEHYFECDECFEQTQLASRFIAGVRDAAHHGNFVNSDDRSLESPWRAWFRPVLVLSLATSAVLAIAFAWLWLVKIPALKREVVEERSARQNGEHAATEQLARQREQHERELESLTRQAGPSQLPGNDKKPPQEKIARLEIDRVPGPVVTLEASRSSGGSVVEVPVSWDATNITLWIPVEPLGRFRGFNVQLTLGAAQVHSVRNVKPNREGALSVKVPTLSLLSFDYVVKVYGVGGGKTAELLGEYPLRITRHE